MEKLMASMTLSMEQNFNLVALRQGFQNLTRSELEDLLIDAAQTIMIKENTVKHLVKEGIDRGYL